MKICNFRIIFIKFSVNMLCMLLVGMKSENWRRLRSKEIIGLKVHLNSPKLYPIGRAAPDHISWVDDQS